RLCSLSLERRNFSFCGSLARGSITEHWKGNPFSFKSFKEKQNSPVRRHNRCVQLDFNNALRARLVGPHRGGRVTAVVGHPTNPQVFYFGHCAGGVWQTSDGGRFWTNISDGYFATGAVGALAISESDPNVLYAGMGET